MPAVGQSYGCSRMRWPTCPAAAVARAAASSAAAASSGFRALYEQAGVARLRPIRPSARQSSACAERAARIEPGGPRRLKRRMIERVLSGCARARTGRHRAADDAAAPLRHRSRARRGAALLQRNGAEDFLTVDLTSTASRPRRRRILVRRTRRHVGEPCRRYCPRKSTPCANRQLPTCGQFRLTA